MKETFVVKTAWKSVFDNLSDKQAGILIKAVFEYMATGEIPAGLADGEIKMALRFMAIDFDAFNKAYESRCATNRENGRKGADFGKLGGRPSKGDKTPKNPEKPRTWLKNPLNDDDNDNGLKETSSSDDDEEKKATTSTSSPSPSGVFLEDVDEGIPELRVSDPDRDAQNPPPPTPSPMATYDQAERLAETALSKTIWVEAVCMNHGISREKLREQMDTFVLHLRCVGKEHCGRADFLQHFDSWLRKQKRIEQEKPPEPACKVDRDLEAVSSALEQIRLRKMSKNQTQTHETKF